MAESRALHGVKGPIVRGVGPMHATFQSVPGYRCQFCLANGEWVLQHPRLNVFVHHCQDDDDIADKTYTSLMDGIL